MWHFKFLLFTVIHNSCGHTDGSGDGKYRYITMAITVLKLFDKAFFNFVLIQILYL